MKFFLKIFLEKHNFKLLFVFVAFVLCGCDTSKTPIQQAKLRSQSTNAASQWVLFNKVSGNSDEIFISSGKGNLESSEPERVSLKGTVSPFDANSSYEAILTGSSPTDTTNNQAVIAWINSDNLVFLYYIIVTLDADSKISSISEVKETLTHVSSGIRLATNNSKNIILGSVEDSDFQNSMASLFKLNGSTFERLAFFGPAAKPGGSETPSVDRFQLSLGNDNRVFGAMSTKIGSNSNFNPYLSYFYKKISKFDPHSETPVSSISHQNKPMSLIQCRQFGSTVFLIASDVSSSSTSGNIITYVSSNGAALSKLAIPNQSSYYVTGTPLYADIFSVNTPRVYYNLNMTSTNMFTANYFSINKDRSFGSLSSQMVDVSSYDIDSNTELLSYTGSGNFLAFFFSGSLMAIQFDMATGQGSNAVRLSDNSVSEVSSIVTSDGSVITSFIDSSGNSSQKTISKDNLYEDENEDENEDGPAKPADKLLRNSQKYIPFRELKGIF